MGANGHFLSIVVPHSGPLCGPGKAKMSTQLLQYEAPALLPLNLDGGGPCLTSRPCLVPTFSIFLVSFTHPKASTMLVTHGSTWKTASKRL